jgi:hypothetical protein
VPEAIYQGDTVMLRKTMIALFATASVGMLFPSVASARGGFGGGGGGGFHGGGGGGFHGGGFHGGGFGGFRGGGFGGGGFRSAAIGGGGFQSRVIGGGVSVPPQLGAVDFAAEPSQAMVSAAVSTTGSTTMGADLRSVHLHSD